MRRLAFVLSMLVMAPTGAMAQDDADEISALCDFFKKCVRGKQRDFCSDRKKFATLRQIKKRIDDVNEKLEVDVIEFNKKTCNVDFHERLRSPYARDKYYGVWGSIARIRKGEFDAFKTLQGQLKQLALNAEKLRKDLKAVTTSVAKNKEQIEKLVEDGRTRDKRISNVERRTIVDAMMRVSLLALPQGQVRVGRNDPCEVGCDVVRGGFGYAALLGVGTAFKRYPSGHRLNLGLDFAPKTYWDASRIRGEQETHAGALWLPYVEVLWRLEGNELALGVRAAMVIGNSFAKANDGTVGRLGGMALFALDYNFAPKTAFELRLGGGVEDVNPGDGRKGQTSWQGALSLGLRHDIFHGFDRDEDGDLVDVY